MTDNEKELMPCPFCAGEAKHIKGVADKIDPTIYCVDCPCKMVIHGVDKEAFTAWNTRPQPSADKPCETCNGDDKVCASVVSSRHCEKANRDREESSADVSMALDAFMRIANHLPEYGVFSDGSSQSTADVITVHEALTQPKAVDVEEIKKEFERIEHDDGEITYEYQSHDNEDIFVCVS